VLCRRLALIAAVVAVLAPATASAQDFGVAESAETINTGNFKLSVNPMFVFPDDADNEIGVGLRFGYGFTPRFDMEAKAAFYDGLYFLGGDFEYWLVKNRAWDVSGGAGLHIARGDVVADSTGVDLTLLASSHIARRLEFYGALDLAIESVDDDEGEDFTTVHLVPGIEYAISDDLDFVAEAGFSLNDDGSHYVSVGLSYYIR
jgi:Outer membrane protein beta-barrel domain